MAPVVNEMVEHDSGVRSIVSPSAAVATALRRLPMPLSAQLNTDSTCVGRSPATAGCAAGGGGVTRSVRPPGRNGSVYAAIGAAEAAPDRTHAMQVSSSGRPSAFSGDMTASRLMITGKRGGLARFKGYTPERHGRRHDNRKGVAWSKRNPAQRAGALARFTRACSLMRRAIPAFAGMTSIVFVM